MVDLKDLTILISHPDDEIIFGWPVLKQAKTIIAIVGDSSLTTEYPQYKDRILALNEVGKLVGAEVICLHYDSDFYKLPSKDIETLFAKLQELTKDVTVIFTHNEHGDSGHPDHRLTNKLVTHLNKKMIVSNVTIFEKGDIHKLVTGTPIGTYQNNLVFYNKCYHIYSRYNCWTWSNPPIKEATIMEK